MLPKGIELEFGRGIVPTPNHTLSGILRSSGLKEKMVRDTGFEPVTPTMSMWCSTPELTALYSYKNKQRLSDFQTFLINQ